MPKKTDTRMIGELEVTTVQLPATRGSRLRFKLLRMLAPAASALRGLKITNLEDLNKLDVADAIPALSALVVQLDDATQEQLMLELLVCTSVVAAAPKGDGKVKYDLASKAIIDQAFDGDVDALWEVMKVSLEVNLGGFFARATAAAKGTVDAAPASPAPSS